VSIHIVVGLVKYPTAPTQHEPPAQLSEVGQDVGFICDHVFRLVVRDLDRGNCGLLIHKLDLAKLSRNATQVLSHPLVFGGSGGGESELDDWPDGE
jgi:hypothetical protein